MIYCFLAVSAVVPSLLIVWYFHRRDAFPEPARVLWTTFGLGVLTVFPVAVIELLIQIGVDQVPTAVLRGALDAFLVAAFTEESFKLLVLLGYVWRHREFNEPMDGVVYGVVASLGFATFENVLYVFQSGIGVAIMRALTAVPSHATEGAILGYFVGRAKFAKSGRAATVLTGFAIAVVIHGLYDFPLLSLSAAADIAKATGTESSNSLLLLLPCTFITLAGAIGLAWWLTRKLRREQLSGNDIFAPGPRQAAATAGPLTQPEPLPAAAPPVSSRVAPPRPAPPRAATLAALAAGFILGSIGGMVILAVILAYAMGSVKPDEVVALTFGTLIIGVLPMGIGAAVFTYGIDRLNRG